MTEKALSVVFSHLTTASRETESKACEKVLKWVGWKEGEEVVHAVCECETLVACVITDQTKCGILWRRY